MRKEIEAIETVGSVLLTTGTIKTDEPVRMELVETINSGNEDRAAIEKEYGQAWDTNELQRDFEVVGFMAPYCIVRRKSDGKKGTIMFKHSPRFYFGFRAE